MNGNNMIVQSIKWIFRFGGIPCQDNDSCPEFDKVCYQSQPNVRGGPGKDNVQSRLWCVCTYTSVVLWHMWDIISKIQAWFGIHKTNCKKGKRECEQTNGVRCCTMVINSYDHVQRMLGGKSTQFSLSCCHVCVPGYWNWEFTSAYYDKAYWHGSQDDQPVVIACRLQVSE